MKKYLYNLTVVHIEEDETTTHHLFTDNEITPAIKEICQNEDIDPRKYEVLDATQIDAQTQQVVGTIQQPEDSYHWFLNPFWAQTRSTPTAKVEFNPDLFTAQYVADPENIAKEYKTIKTHEAWIHNAMCQIDEGNESSDMEDRIDAEDIKKLRVGLDNPYFVMQSLLIMKQIEDLSSCTEEHINPREFVPQWCRMLNGHQGWVQLMMLWIMG